MLAVYVDGWNGHILYKHRMGNSWSVENTLVLKKLHDKLERVVGMGCMVRESDPPCLIYLHDVVKETLRLHPVFSFSIHLWINQGLYHEESYVVIFFPRKDTSNRYEYQSIFSFMLIKRRTNWRISSARMFQEEVGVW